MPALLIGDRAIDAQFTLPPNRVYDLGTLWHEWTGQDMVYAVWAARREVLQGRHGEVAAAMGALMEAKRWGAANGGRVVEIAQAAHERPAGFYASYYRTLNFDLDLRAQAGLERFISELAAIGAVDGAASGRPEAIVVAR